MQTIARSSHASNDDASDALSLADRLYFSTLLHTKQPYFYHLLAATLSAKSHSIELNQTFFAKTKNTLPHFIFLFIIFSPHNRWMSSALHTEEHISVFTCRTSRVPPVGSRWVTTWAGAHNFIFFYSNRISEYPKVGEMTCLAGHSRRWDRILSVEFFFISKEEPNFITIVPDLPILLQMLFAESTLEGVKLISQFDHFSFSFLIY